ncbi:hypothetical protein B9Z55_025150 [Caenorhabditis nigoni]|uniref:Uncharacterized protein n=1 Tax=Caenorhabditis nigoni TaxID=1611254 RepID=A0A2G5SXH9_9PELO|nr:hypothetical protein B9Z55_025150 [Caenorhabditis nigoni]
MSPRSTTTSSFPAPQTAASPPTTQPSMVITMKVSAHSGKNGPEALPSVPLSNRRSQRIATTVPLFRQCRYVPRTVPTFWQRSQEYDNGPTQQA